MYDLRSSVDGLLTSVFHRVMEILADVFSDSAARNYHLMYTLLIALWERKGRAFLKLTRVMKGLCYFDLVHPFFKKNP